MDHFLSMLSLPLVWFSLDMFISIKYPRSQNILPKLRERHYRLRGNNKFTLKLYGYVIIHGTK